ncbi:MAG: protein-methionine-sulfoxide reductase catalytic subunit MsrP, partial [Geminicoccales bacterium]
MNIRKKRGWELPEKAATPERVYLDRRRILAGLGLGGAILAAPAALRMAPEHMRGAQAEPEPSPDPWADLYPVQRNDAYWLDRPLTEESWATSYNNFYEFGSHKQIASAAQALQLQPWTVTIDGMVETARALDADELIRRMPLEERLYRHRCVEAWSMAVPWSGFPLAALVDFARPLSGASYLRMETFMDAEMAPGQRQSWYPWPYIEGLTMAEATNELAFIATGLYGRPMPCQNGAPLRLVAPWKYGFKSVKSIVRFTFTDERPVTFWEAIQPSEYGFWANVNPEVPHPRW